MKREYMTGMSLTSYISSKLVVLGVLCLIQSLLLTGVFSATLVIPNDYIDWNILQLFEVFITTFLSSLAATAIGLLVSSIVSNPDRAMTFAPFLLMPQLLLAGALFTLEGAMRHFSLFTVCRWGISGYSAAFELTSDQYSRALTQNPIKTFEGAQSASLTITKDTPYALQIGALEPKDIGYDASKFKPEELEIFGETGDELITLLTSWGAMIVMIAVCVIIARVVIGRISKDNS